MNRYHLLLITPTENKKFSIIADDFYNDESGSLVFTNSDENVIAVYPVGITAIESIDYDSDEF